MKILSMHSKILVGALGLIFVSALFIGCVKEPERGRIKTSRSVEDMKLTESDKSLINEMKLMSFNEVMSLSKDKLDTIDNVPAFNNSITWVDFDLGTKSREGAIKIWILTCVQNRPKDYAKLKKISYDSFMKNMNKAIDDYEKHRTDIRKD